MAEQNPDGTVTMKPRGSLAYTPTASSGIVRSASRGPGGLSGTSGSNGRLQRAKGTAVGGTSAYR
jgi:hypothetical protein